MNLEMRDRMYGLEQCVLDTPETSARGRADRDWPIGRIYRPIHTAEGCCVARWRHHREHMLILILTLKHMLWRLFLKVFLKLESNFSCFTIHSIIACFIGTVSEDIPNQDAKQCSVSTNVKRNRKAWDCRKKKKERNDSSSSLCLEPMKVIFYHIQILILMPTLSITKEEELSFRSEVQETSETPLDQKKEVSYRDNLFVVWR